MSHKESTGMKRIREFWNPGVFWSFLSAFLWATVYVATRWLMRGEEAKVDPVTLSLLRFGAGGCCCFSSAWR